MAEESLPMPRSFELTKEILEAAKELIKANSEVQKKTSETAKKVTESSAKASKRIAVNATSSIDDIISGMDKGLEKASKKAKKQVEDIGEAVRKEQEKTEAAQHKHIQNYLKKHKEVKQRHHSLFEALSPEHRTAYGKVMKRKATNFLLGESGVALGAISGLVMRIAPQIAVIMSLAKAIQLVIDQFFDLDKETVALSMNLGGDYKTALDVQVHTYGEVVEATNLTKQSVQEMGLAFYQAGIPLTKNTESLVEYMTVAGNLNKVTGASFEQLAKYTETLRHAGKSAGDVFDAYDAMYEKMHKYQLTVADFNSSLTEGDDLWGEFGSRSNQTLTQLQTDVLATKGIFKSFNLDVKATGGLLQSMMGDPKTQMRQAALVAAMKGKGQASAFVDIATGSSIGAQDLIESLVRYATKFPEAHYGESQAQLSKLGDAGMRDVLISRSRLEENMSKQFKMPEKMVSQILSDYNSFMGTNPGSSIKTWVDKRIRDHSDPDKPGGLMEALQTKDNSVESSLTKISNTVLEIADHIAYFALEQMPPIITCLNNIFGALKFMTLGALGGEIKNPMDYEQFKKLRNQGKLEEFHPTDTKTPDEYSKWKDKYMGKKEIAPPLFMPPPISASQSPQAYDKWAAKYLKKESPSGAGLPPPLFVPPPVGKKPNKGIPTGSISVTSKKKYPDYVLKGAYKAWAETGVPIEATLAQWKLEGASDGSLLASKYNNPFGIKAMKGLSKKYGTVTLPTTEVWGGKKHHVMGKFQVFPDKETAFVERGKMLMNPKGYYKKSIPLAGDLDKYLPAMGKVYATDPIYAKKLSNVIERDKLEAIASELKMQNAHLSKLLEATVQGNEHREKAHKENKMNLALNKGNPAAQLQQQVINQSIL